MLVLFDVDATLITTARAGVWSLQEGGRELYGTSFTADRTEFAGRLDPLILADLLRDNGLEPTPTRIAELRQVYRAHLERRLATGPTPRALPGVMDLLAALRARQSRPPAAAGDHPGIVLGLLTGNFPETGAIKLRACGIDPEAFPIRVWGDESPYDLPCRDHLPPLAIERYRERYGRPVDPDAVTVIGDTPYDVACARASGCRVIGVATGWHSVDDLRSAGADWVVADLSGTREIVSWLMREP